MSITRRDALALGTAAAFSTAVPLRAQTQAVSFRLNWILYGFHTPFHLGVERGFYRAEGIDLTIGEGQGSVRTVQTVAARGDMFGLSDSGSVIAGAARGAPVRSILAITNSSPYAITGRTDKGVNSLKDLEGKTLAGAPGEAGLQLLPALFQRAGVDMAKVRILRVEGAGKMVAFAEGRAEALLAGLDNQSITLRRQGLPTKDFGYAEAGLNTVGLTIHTHRDTIAQNPDLVRRFARATVRAFEAAIADPEASIRAGQKVKPDMEMSLSVEQLKVGISLMRSPRSRALPAGHFAPEDWQETLDLMKQYQDLQTSEPASAFFTNELAPAARS
jgi:NitT/TauT family transport system substrate-binding protein